MIRCFGFVLFNWCLVMREEMLRRLGNNDHKTEESGCVLDSCQWLLTNYTANLSSQ